MKRIVLCLPFLFPSLLFAVSLQEVQGSYWRAMLEITSSTGSVHSSWGSAEITGNQYKETYNTSDGRVGVQEEQTLTDSDLEDVYISQNNDLVIDIERIRDSYDDDLNLFILLRKEANPARIKIPTGQSWDYWIFTHNIGSGNTNNSVSYGTLRLNANGTGKADLKNEKGIQTSTALTWSIKSDATIQVVTQGSTTPQILGMGPNADILLQADLTGSLGYTFCLRKSSTQVETTPNHGYHVAEFSTPYTLKTATTNWGTFMLYPSLQWEATLQTSDRDFDHPQGTYKTTPNGFDLHDEEEMVLPFVFDPTGSLGIGVDHTIDETDPEDNWLGLILVIKGSESAPLLVPEPKPEFSFNSHVITHPYLNLWQPGFEMIQTGYGSKSGHQRSLKADTVEWVNDISCLRVLISDSEAGIWLIFRFAQDTEGNVRLIHRQFWENGVPVEDQYFDNPPIFLPAMLQVGTEIYHGIDDGVATVAAMDTTVPSNEFGYGPYSPCIQVMQVYQGGSDIDYEYLALGLGMIQRDLGSDDGPGGYKVSSITDPGQEPTPTPWEFPTATPTPECPPQPTPGVQRYAVHEFAEDSLSQTGWNEIPGGFGNATPGVYRIGYAFLPGLIPSSQDQKGMQVSVRAGEVTFLYAPSLDLQNKHFYARMTLRSDGADVQLVLGALRGDMATQYNLDGSLEMHLIRTATAFVEQEKKMELTYRPDQGTIITPFLQISANGETPVTVWIDRIEFYLLDRTPDSQ